MHFSLYSSPNHFLFLSSISRVFSIVKPPGMIPIEVLYNKNAVWH